MSSALRVPTDADVEEVARLWSDGWPDARLDRSGYAHVDALDAGRVWIDVRGRPTAALVDWAEGRAGEHGGRRS